LRVRAPLQALDREKQLKSGCGSPTVYTHEEQREEYGRYRNSTANDSLCTGALYDTV